MFQRIWSELQYLQEKGPNYNVCNAKVRITIFITKRFKLQWLSRYGLNYNVCKDNVRIMMCERKRSEFQYLKG